jgi:hypothetical protein
MKANIISIIFLLFFSTSFGSMLSVEGIYQGKNVYVQNPVSSDGFGYCASKVMVNGDIVPSNTGNGDFEIDLSDLNISIGEPLFIVIEHEDGCKPIIINPEVLLPRSTYVISKMTAEKSGILEWETSKEHGKLPFLIEQFRWNKWVTVGEVQGVGTSGKHLYAFKVAPHSGQNTVRIVQVDHTGLKRPSKEVKFTSLIPKVSKNPTKVKDVIHFTANNKPIETRFEIFDAYGNIVKKGVGASVNCKNLVRGAYYINFDNTNEKFIKN